MCAFMPTPAEFPAWRRSNSANVSPEMRKAMQDIMSAFEEDMTRVVGLAITEHMRWDMLVMRNMLRQLPLLAPGQTK